MKRPVIVFALLQIVLICDIFAQDFPRLGEIDGQKVVIWTLDQDKENTILIEHFYECDTLLKNADSQILQYKGVVKSKDGEIRNIRSELKASEEQYQNQVEETTLCDEQKDNEIQIAKSHKKQKRIFQGTTAILLIIILL